MFYATPANDFEKAATAVGGIYAPTENGNPRNSKGMAGIVLKTSRFYAMDLAVCSVKTARAAQYIYGKL